MEEYINLYHQKLWEIAFSNVLKTFINYKSTSWFLLIFIAFILNAISKGRKKQLIVVACIPFLLFILCLGVEYLYSYDKIMNPKSLYNDSLFIASLKSEKVSPVLENVDEFPIASVDGDLKRKDIILFAVANPSYFDALFGNTEMYLSGKQTVGTNFVIALVDFEEKQGEWQSVDIRIAPGDAEKDLKKFSKILHIKRGEREGAEGIILTLQKLHESTLRKEKNGE
ncbi:MAG: hypothetical protein HXP01_06630 [Streptococcus sp.]|uniref:hypothetical protein n=1 Tax=Streptococcus sp. TaxID=1306 RepID=UPI001CB056EE|nr:hypothetical protein [Streptococcus sp.]MBF1739114.1 hypothetical protein [Streptococcus sp.]